MILSTYNHLFGFSGNLGIGHTRYSTTAGSSEVNCQPFVVHTIHGALAIAHNGEIMNASALRQKVNFTIFRKNVFVYVSLQ